MPARRARPASSADRRSRTRSGASGPSGTPDRPGPRPCEQIERVPSFSGRTLRASTSWFFALLISARIALGFQRFGSRPSDSWTLFTRRSAWSASKMLKVRSHPSRSACRRSRRAPMAWKVPTHIPVGLRPSRPADALPHLAGGLVGERHREDPVRGDAVLVDQMADPGREHPGLAGSRTGEHEQRPLEVLGGLALLGVQPLEMSCARRTGHSGIGHRQADLEGGALRPLPRARSALRERLPRSGGRAPARRPTRPTSCSRPARRSCRGPPGRPPGPCRGSAG